MIFSIFCGVSLFDLLLIGVATFTYFRNKRLQKKLDSALSELSINKDGQVYEQCDKEVYSENS